MNLVKPLFGGKPLTPKPLFHGGVKRKLGKSTIAKAAMFIAKPVGKEIQKVIQERTKRTIASFSKTPKPPITVSEALATDRRFSLKRLQGKLVEKKQLLDIERMEKKIKGV